MPIRISPSRKGRSFRNTRRENRLEELGRVDAERAHTSRGKRNLREEKDRIRSELKSGGRPAPKGGIGKLKQTERKAGPSAPNPRKKIFKIKPQTPSRKYFRNKTHGGGPDSGNIGKMKDMLSKFKDKGLGKTVSPAQPDLSQIKKHMKKYKTPLRKGGRARGPNRPRPTGPHMWVRGDKRKKYSSGSAVSKSGGITHKKTTGIAPSKKSQKKYYEKQRDAVREMNMSGRGKQLRDRTFTDKKTGRLVPDTKRNRERYGKDRVYKSKASGGRIKYASGGVVMAGKKVGCQIK